jgi:hypothetical protein
MTIHPPSAGAARELLEALGAPSRLLRHVELVGEAADLLLQKLVPFGAGIDADLVRVGVVLHDAGKTLHPAELDQPGGDHEPAGEALLIAHGASPEVARICISHARWNEMSVSLEELLVALADKLWKGVRKPELEERVIDEVASAVGKSRWDLFVDLDSCFEQIAAGGTARLERSRE